MWWGGEGWGWDGMGWEGGYKFALRFLFLKTNFTKDLSWEAGGPAAGEHCWAGLLLQAGVQLGHLWLLSWWGAPARKAKQQCSATKNLGELPAVLLMGRSPCVRTRQSFC